ncbi:MAG TPA: class I SAM-dependent rRNA methyltransferase [Polyangiaceae bacterium]|jgi:23S rRNA (cytosine1962-C5)-methyltransferase|nr:class I SAM-dependent rRNA methyltransferase [Polyangiaceae bacterium]
MTMVRLKPGHVQPVWAGHPWIYAQAIDAVDRGATAGDEVSVIDPRGNLLGRGFYSPGSAIPVRLLVRDPSTQIDAAFFRTRFEQALALRASIGLPSDGPEATTGYRVVHAEGDGVPGLVVDRFGDVVAVQFGTIGMKRRADMVLDALEAAIGPRAIVDRTSAQTAKMEGFEPSSGVVRGPAGEVTALDVVERGLRFRIPLELGQKTGFYFDQRSLRGRVEQLARGKRVLDAYAFVGAFAIGAARGGAAEVVAVDESAAAIAAGVACAALNGVAEKIRFVKADARKELAEARGAFDLVVADPPRLAPTRGARDQALLAYGRLAENACGAVRPGGLLVLCSCSAAVDLTALTRALATGATRANVQATVLERFFQGPDHPVPAAFGEGLYLKALIARVDPR